MNDLNETLPYYYKYTNYSYEYNPQPTSGAPATPQSSAPAKPSKKADKGSQAGEKSQSGRRSVSNQ
jgi:hypothetical protein